MAFKTFVAGATLTAAEVNTYLAKQAVIVCTSSTRPSSPPEGMTIYETDTDKMLIYTTATTGWQPPWNMPWGVLAYAQTVTPQGTFTSLTDLTGVSSPALTLPANRRVRITASGMLQSTVTTDQGELHIREGGTTLKQMNIPALGGAAAGVEFSAVVVPTAGSHTYKVSAARGFGGSGNVSTIASSTYPNFILVEDIGPAGAPA